MSAGYNDMQLDALRELANIASGTAATALSQMLGREVDMNVPMAVAVPLPDAVEMVGDPAEVVTAVVLEVSEGLSALVVLLLKPASAATLCGLLGVDPDSEVGASALGEIGNIVGTSYLSAISSMTALALTPSTPAVASDLLGAIVATTLAATVAANDEVILVDSQLHLPDETCEITFMLLPRESEISALLAPFGLAETAG